VACAIPPEGIEVCPALPVGADNAVTSRDLGILVYQAAEPVASSDADVVFGGRGGDLGVGRSLAEGPAGPMGVVVIDVFAERMVQVSPAGDEDAVGALASGAGDPPLADRVRPRRLVRRTRAWPPRLHRSSKTNDDKVDLSKPERS